MNEFNRKPMISVIMGIYNCQKTVADAIESILQQTFQDFEFIICDDGSQDDSFAIIQKYAHDNPNKIVLIKNECNRGLNYTLNHCLKYAKGKYIARMDGDDKSLPERFEKEIDFLEKNPQIAILSASLRVFDDNGVWGIHSFKDYPNEKDFMKGSPFSHSVCMVKREAFEAVNGYSEEKLLLRVEDYHLWIKMYSKGYRGANLQDELYLYRDDRDGYRKRKFKYRINEAYVMSLAVKMLKLPLVYYVYIFKPILIGLLPFKLYDLLHKKKMNKGAIS